MLYETWTASKQWRIRPSELLRIRDEVAAYHLDRAVLLFGMALEQDIQDTVNPPSKEAKTAMAKAQLVLDRWLREPAQDPRAEIADAQAKARAQGRSGFKDPAERFTKKE